MKNKLSLEGVDYSPYIRGLDLIDLEVGAGERASTFGVSSEVAFFGKAYEFLLNRFFKDCSGITEEIKGVLFIGSCNKEIEILIRADAVSLRAFDCEIDVVITNEQKINQFLIYLKTTRIGRNGFDQAINHIMTPYAVQPGWVIYVLILIRSILFLIITIPAFIINQLQNIKEAYDKLITGTGRNAVTPLVREIFDYHCQVNGFVFKSSIFNAPTSPYYNCGIICLQNDRGIDSRDLKSGANWQANNEPFETLEEILDFLATTFNADWRIVGNELIFEKYTKIWEIAKNNTFFSIGKLDIRNADTTYEWDVAKQNATFKADYTRDQHDSQGNGLLNYGYTEVLNWNPQKRETIRGIQRVSIPFSPIRVSFDQVSFDSSNKLFNFEFQMDAFRAGAARFDLDLLGGLGNIGLNNAPIPNATRLVIFDSQINSQLKLICFEDISNRRAPRIQGVRFARRIIDNSQSLLPFFFFDYNIPLYVERGHRSGLNTLYENFFEVDDPNNGRGNFLIIGEVTFDFSCSALDVLLDRAPLVGIETPFGIGIAEKFTIDFEACRVSAEGIKILCNFEP
jgi:hypothetical protein